MVMNILNIDANYEIDLAHSVYWVPIIELGGTRYTDEQINEVVKKTVQEKILFISTLYEAIQLLIASNFLNCADAVRVIENGKIWEHHKSGFHAIRTNSGCCSSSASWLYTMLENKYDEFGYIMLFRNTGAGHVINYIRHNSWYYMIDPMAYSQQYLANAICETGNKADIIGSKFFTSIFVKTKDLKRWEKYYNRFFIRSGNKNFCVKLNEPYCVPICIENNTNMIRINMPDSSDFELLSDNQDTSFSIEKVSPPITSIDWNYLPTYIWKTEGKDSGVACLRG